MKKGKIQVNNFVSYGSNSRHENKLHQKDNKGKSDHEKKKTNMKEQHHKAKKSLLKGNYKFCKKYEYKKSRLF